MRSIRLLFFIVFLFLSGCANPLGERRTETDASKVSEKIASRQALTVEKAAKFEPPPSLEIAVPIFAPTQPIVKIPQGKLGGNDSGAQTIQQSPNSVTVRIPSRSDSTLKASSDGDISASGKASAQYSVLRDVSLGGKLLLLAVGVGALYFVFELLRKRYRSVDLVAKKLDEAGILAEKTIANRINTIKEKVFTVTDPVDNAKLASELASLNEERGKLKVEMERLRSKV